MTVLEELRHAVEGELAMIDDQPDAFDSGAAAAYNYVLSLLPLAGNEADPPADPPSKKASA